MLAMMPAVVPAVAMAFLVIARHALVRGYAGMSLLTRGQNLSPTCQRQQHDCRECQNQTFHFRSL